MLETMQKPTPHVPGKITATGKDRCRFDLFIRRWPRYIEPGQSATWCHRGDKFYQEPDKMLCSLISLFEKNHYKWSLAILFDNTRPVGDKERIVMRWFKGVVEENRLANYAAMLENFALPEILKP